MGLTKQYLRYVATAVFGVIGSPKANIAYVTIRGGEKGRFVAVAACEHVFIWDVRKGEKVCLTFLPLVHSLARDDKDVSWCKRTDQMFPPVLSLMR